MAIYHFYSDYEPRDPATKARQRVARMTWKAQLWRDLPIKDSNLARRWQEEGRSYPYVRDLFDAACSGKDASDCMIYTNADVCVVTKCVFLCVSELQETEAFYSFRRDFNHDFDAPIPDDVVARGVGYAGSDLYGFRVRWWRAQRNQFPDMLIGTEAWDAVLRRLMDETNRGKPTRLDDTHYHRRHASTWENPANRYRLGSQRHNLKLASAWLRAHGVNPASHGIKEGTWA